ncbi:MAG: MerR family transcriptional regulator [Candidatus Marithrix sp.]|nr:MerR family transcriptional regulator [Candidatus Marithrix sp.]
MDNKYRLHKFAKKIGVSTNTLRIWDNSGKLIAKRTLSNHRYYDESDLRQLYGIKKEDRKTVVYCRVSNAGQKDDLKSKIAAKENKTGYY